MYPTRPPSRRASAQQYRMRRAAAASVVVLVLYGTYQLLGGGGGGDDTVTTGATSTSVTTTTAPAVPACREGDVTVPEDPEAQWATIIVDTERALPLDYGPRDLHNISGAGFEFTEGIAVRGIVLEDLSRLRQAAADNGTPITILAGYRSAVTQADLLERRVNEFGSLEAGSRVARPGHSEHQLGTTIDVASAGMTDVDQSWGSTPAGQWIAGNAYKYGFVLSYPPESQELTCYDYEPWHLRYVGPDQAAQVIASGLPLRHYLYRLGVNSPLPETTVPPTTSTSSTTTVG